MGISLKGFGNSNGQGAQIAGLTALPPAAADIRLSTTSSDPHWSNVSLLANFDDLIDTSNNANAITLEGAGATLNGFTTKFGASSAQTTSNGDYLEVADSTPFIFGTDDFTIEYWLNTSQSAANIRHISYGGNNVSGGWFIALNSGQPRFGSGTLWIMQASGSTVADGAWHHIAWCRVSGTLTCFVDGVDRGSSATAFDVVTASTLNVGRDNVLGGTQAYNGNMDELRITKSVARYTSGFTVETEAFPTS